MWNWQYVNREIIYKGCHDAFFFWDVSSSYCSILINNVDRDAWILWNAVFISLFTPLLILCFPFLACLFYGLQCCLKKKVSTCKIQSHLSFWVLFSNCFKNCIDKPWSWILYVVVIMHQFEIWHVSYYNQLLYISVHFLVIVVVMQ